MRLVILALVALSLGGCAQITKWQTGIDPSAQLVSKQDVQFACTTELLVYAGWEASGAYLPKSVKNPEQLRQKIRAASTAVQAACDTLPTTPAEGAVAVMAAVKAFKAQLAAVKNAPA